MRKCYIYGIYRKNNPDNIIYVGQHNYINKNDCYMGSGKKIKEVYEKEGRKNFGKIIFEDLEYNESIEEDRKKIGAIEKYYIKKFKDINQAELNILKGSGPSIVIVLPDGMAFEEYVKNKSRQFYEEHRKEILEKAKKYAEENKECIKKYKKEYRIKNSEKLKKNDKEYYKTHKKEYEEYCKKNKEHIAMIKKKYNEEHKKHLDEKHKEWAIKNREHILALKKRHRYFLKMVKKEEYEKYKTLTKKEKTKFIEEYLKNIIIE